MGIYILCSMVIILLSPSLRGRARRLPRALRALAMTKHGHYVIARKDACPLEAIPPTHVIARSAEGTTKQSLFFSTIGSSIRLGPRDRRLPRALRALAMTDIGTQGRKRVTMVYRDTKGPVVFGNDRPFPRHCEEGRSPDEAISLLPSFWNHYTIVT